MAGVKTTHESFDEEEITFATLTESLSKRYCISTHILNRLKVGKRGDDSFLCNEHYEVALVSHLLA
jgi:hypothetical protein